MGHLEAKIELLTNQINATLDLIEYYHTAEIVAQLNEEIDKAHKFFVNQLKLNDHLDKLYKQQEAIYKDLLIFYL